jgi:hypothetical protein
MPTLRRRVWEIRTRKPHEGLQETATQPLAGSAYQQPGAVKQTHALNACMLCMRELLVPPNFNIPFTFLHAKNMMCSPAKQEK